MDFAVYPYSRGTLLDLLSDGSISPEPELTRDYIAEHKSLHLRYFDDYFEELGAKSVIVEYEYIDRDFLEDYAAYYVRCFRNLRKKCVRLHFLRTKLDAQKFEILLTEVGADSAPANLPDGDYLGFIVVRPLPDALFGRTCVRTYPAECSDGDTRHFPVARQYDLSLFGLTQSVNTLAFQEQDTVAAACASSALWSAFQATCKLYGHEALSPIEVTRRATQYYRGIGRPVPSRGLAPHEMIRAIRDVGLESHTYQLLAPDTDESAVKALIYAYSKMGAPVILGLHLFDTSKHKYEGAHAVTVAGYRLTAKSPVSSDNTRFHSDRLVKVYVNDDHIGPFARMEFTSDACKEKDILIESFKATQQYLGDNLVVLTTSWGIESGFSVVAVPDLAMIPVYHKIRIEMPAIAGCVQELDERIIRWCNWVLSPGKANAAGYEWDVFLDTVSGFRNDIRGRHDIDSNLKAVLLTTQMPRFLWRAIGYDGERRMIELLFDATGVERSRFFLRAIVYDVSLGNLLRAVVRSKSQLSEPFRSPQIDWILDSFT